MYLLSFITSNRFIRRPRIPAYHWLPMNPPEGRKTGMYILPTNLTQSIGPKDSNIWVMFIHVNDTDLIVYARFKV